MTIAIPEYYEGLTYNSMGSITVAMQQYTERRAITRRETNTILGKANLETGTHKDNSYSNTIHIQSLSPSQSIFSASDNINICHFEHNHHLMLTTGT